MVLSPVPDPELILNKYLLEDAGLGRLDPSKQPIQLWYKELTLSDSVRRAEVGPKVAESEENPQDQYTPHLPLPLPSPRAKKRTLKNPMQLQKYSPRNSGCYNCDKRHRFLGFVSLGCSVCSLFT